MKIQKSIETDIKIRRRQVVKKTNDGKSKGGKPKNSKYALKFARRVHLANKIGTRAWYVMVKHDGTACRSLPHAMVVLQKMLS